MHARSRRGSLLPVRREKCVSQVRIDCIAAALTPQLETTEEDGTTSPSRKERKRSATQNSVLVSSAQDGQGVCLFSSFDDDQLYVVDSAAGLAGRCDNVLAVSTSSVAKLADNVWQSEERSSEASDVGVRHLFSARLTEGEDVVSPVGPLLGILPNGAPCYVARGTHTIFTNDLPVKRAGSTLSVGTPECSPGSDTLSPTFQTKGRHGRRASAPHPLAGDEGTNCRALCAGTMALDGSCTLLARLVAPNVVSWPTMLEVWDIWDGKMLFSMSQSQLSTSMASCSFLQGHGGVLQLLHSKFTNCVFSPDSEQLLALVHASVLPLAGEQCSAFLIDVKKASNSTASAGLSGSLRWLRVLSARSNSTTCVRHLACVFHPKYAASRNFKHSESLLNSIAVLSHLQQTVLMQTMSWRRLLVFDAKSSEQVWESSSPCSQVDVRFLDLKFSEDGEFLALSLGNSAIELFSGKDGSPLRILDAQQRYGVGVHLHSITISPSARWIAAMAGKAEMCLWIGHVACLRHLCLLALKQQCLKCGIIDINSTLLRLLPHRSLDN